jgi:hypothetical protein
MTICTETTFDSEAHVKQMPKPSFFSDKAIGSVKRKYDDYIEAFLDNVFGHDCKLDRPIFSKYVIEKE